MDTLEWLIAYLPGVGEPHSEVNTIGGGAEPVRTMMRAALAVIKAALGIEVLP
jgi:hypothetical protein